MGVASDAGSTRMNAVTSIIGRMQISPRSRGVTAKESVVPSVYQNEWQKHHKNASEGRRTSPNEPGWSINQCQASMSARGDFNHWK